MSVVSLYHAILMLLLNKKTFLASFVVRRLFLPPFTTVFLSNLMTEKWGQDIYVASFGVFWRLLESFVVRRLFLPPFTTALYLFKVTLCNLMPVGQKSRCLKTPQKNPKNTPKKTPKETERRQKMPKDVKRCQKDAVHVWSQFDIGILQNTWLNLTILNEKLNFL